MTRRDLRHTLALPVLVATLMCVLLPVPVLAQPGQSHGKSQREDSGYQGSKGKREAANDQRDNGGNRGNKSGRGHSDQKNQRPDDTYDYGKSRGENSGRGRSDENHQTSEKRNNNDRKAQRSQSLSPQQAAQRARSQYGGQVLKVQPAGGGYQVRLLKEDGRVVTVPIED
jgi:hypothetical protein